MVLVQPYAGLRLADVLVSCHRALSAEDNPLGLSGVRSAAVLVVDGMGSHNLRENSGHARFLTQAWRKRSLIADAGFPSTTASALTSLTTGELPGSHGIAGYTLRDPASGVVINHLKEWKPTVQPDTWQRCETIFERAAAQGIASLALGEDRFQGSDFTSATWRGATFSSTTTLSDQVRVMRDFFDHHDRALVYLYWPALDRTGHSSGVSSDSWVHRLEELDDAVREFAPLFRDDEGLVITSDHGMLDVAENDKIVLDEDSPLLEGVTGWAGEPRAPQLYFESETAAAKGQARWKEGFGNKALVLSRAELVQTGLLGEVHPDVEARLGDVIVLCQEPIVFYRQAQSSPMSLRMRGQHGSITEVEREIPVIPLGAWA